MSLDGQGAVVTGAGRGIGRAIAEELARAGVKVALVARTGGQLAEVETAINTWRPGYARAFVADVRDPQQVDALLAEADGWLGGASLLVNNAGTGGPAGNWWEADAASWWECVESIVRGAYNCTRALLPAMLDRKAGRIVAIASTTGTRESSWGDATSAAKTTLIRQVENLAAATAGRGVYSFALHPGIVRTALLEGYRSSAQVAAMLDSIPDSMYSAPELAGQAVVRIAQGEFDRFNGCFLDATRLDELKAGEASLGADSLKLRIVPLE